ncbi:MAG: HPP family protein [Rhodomicrobiaceae bacterium]
MAKFPAIRILICALSASGGIALMVALAKITAVPLGTIPFATSIVLVSGAPRSAAARTKTIIFGHLICGAVGVFMHHTGFEATVAVAAAVGASVALMLALNVFHPPAGITPLVLYGSDMTWTFLIVPVLVGAVSVAILARTTQKLLDLTDRAEAATFEAASRKGRGDQGDA